MDSSQLHFFRTLLEERLRDLLVHADGDLEVEEDEAEMLDAAEDTDTEFALRLRDREKALVVKLRAAMARLRDGDYGICAACGGEIELKRLVARPTAIHCLDCRSSETFLPRQEDW